MDTPSSESDPPIEAPPADGTSQAESELGTATGPRRQLTLLDTVCIIVGTIIGAGIFETTPRIAENVEGPGWLIGVWLLGGVIALLGAMCYAELATTYPGHGGDYVYLSRAYGSWMGYLFAWAEFWVIRPSSIGAMAYVFASYACLLFQPSREDDAIRWPEILLAAGAVLVLGGLNLLGVHAGKWLQNVLTAIKVAGLVVVFTVGFLAPVAPLEVAEAPVLEESGRSIFLAMILVMFTYGGWADMPYVAAEVRTPNRNIPRSLGLGLLAVCLIYVLVNAALLRGLGFDAMGHSKVVTNLLQSAWGDAGRRFISGLICVSCLGAISAMLFTGARVYYAVGCDHPLLRWLGRWDGERGSPIRALVAENSLVLVLVVVFGSYGDGFERLVVFSSPLFWSFFLLSGIALFVLRTKDGDLPRTYRVHFYPFTPLLFCLSSFLMAWASWSYAFQQGHAEGWFALAVMVIGLLLLLPRRTAK